MAERYFDLCDDIMIPGRWELGELLHANGQELEDPWVFRVSEPVQLRERLRVSLVRKGFPVDFSHAAFSTPEVHVRAAEIFYRLAPDDIQLIPVDVDGHPDQYLVLNAIRLIKCIDENATEELERWTPEDGRPDKIGKYRAVYGMRIDPSKVGGAKVFRTWGWSVALVVSGEIKDALEAAGITGLEFKEV